jgi:hypothetical protein
MQRLQTYFDPEDMAEIVKIKTSSRNDADFITWQPEKRGLFSVKSAYQLALHSSEAFQDRGASSVRPDGQWPS